MGVNGAELNRKKVSEDKGKSSLCSRVPVPSAPQPVDLTDTSAPLEARRRFSFVVFLQQRFSAEPGMN